MIGAQVYHAWLEAKSRGRSRADFAAELGIPPKKLDNILYQTKSHLQFLERHADLPKIDLGQPLELEGDFVIVGDVHLPTCDYGMAHLVSDIGKKHLGRKPRLLIAGDLINGDAFSHWTKSAPGPSWLEERAAAKALMSEWQSVFKGGITILMGNHDRRLTRMLGGSLDEKDFLSLIVDDKKNITVSNFGYCTINSNGVRWRVTHPRGYSSRRLALADDLAQKYQMNVITFHQHHLGHSISRYGNFVIVDGGCLAENTQVAYAALDDSKMTSWAKGFVLLKGGVARVFGEYPFTDWSEFGFTVE